MFQGVLSSKTRKGSSHSYTMGEEVFNAVSHGVGAVLGLIAGTVLVTLASVRGSAVDITACAIYTLSLVVLYTMSTLYHSFPFPKLKKLFRIFDHSSVFLLIAGTYTPFMLMLLKGQIRGLVIFIVIWACTLIGILLNSINIESFARTSMILYICMGWCIVFALKQILIALPSAGFWLLLAGGLCYTVGILFYISRKKFMHSIWHLFVLAGSTLHFICIAAYILPKAS